MDKQKVELSDLVNRDVIGYTLNNGYISVYIMFLRNGQLVGANSNIFPIVGQLEEDIELYIINFYANFFIYTFYNYFFQNFSIFSFFKNIFYPEDIKLPMVLITGSEAVYSMLFYIFRFLLRGNLELGYCFVHIILPEIVYTILVTIVLYKVIVFINEQLEIYERRNS